MYVAPSKKSYFFTPSHFFSRYGVLEVTEFIQIFIHSSVCTVLSLSLTLSVYDDDEKKLILGGKAITRAVRISSPKRWIHHLKMMEVVCLVFPAHIHTNL